MGDCLIPRAGRFWTPEEEDSLRCFYREGLPRQAMAKILNRSVEGIQKKATMLNLTKREYDRAYNTGHCDPGFSQERKRLIACNEAFCQAMEAAGYVRRIGKTTTNSAGSTR